MGLLRTIYYCLRLRRHDKFTPQRVERFQRQQLRKMVRFAQQRSPFFAEHYAGIDPSAPDFSIEALPPTSKEMLMDNFDRVVTDRRLKLADVQRWVSSPEKVGQWYRGRYVLTTTSGTTGAPGYFVYDRRDWDWIQAFAVTRGIRFKPSFLQFWYYAGRILAKKVRVALVSVLSGHFITHVLFRLTPRIGKLVSRFYFLSVIDPVERLVEQLNEIDPNVLHCYPTVLEVLAHEKLEGRLRIDPWVITCSSEALTQSARAAIAKAFPNAPLFETYGTSEGVNLASECTQHAGLHLNNDLFILEPVRHDGTPVEAGQAGDKLYLSCLFARAMPILRYEISDQTATLTEPCPCGLPYPLLQVEGRTDDTLWVDGRDGEPVALPPIPFEALFLGIDDLVQYQLVQAERDLLRIHFRIRAGADEARVADALRGRFADYLEQKAVSGDLRVELERVDEIARDPVCGKIRQIFSQVERPFIPDRPLGDRRSGRERRISQAPPPEDAERRQAERRSLDPDGGGD